MRIMYLADRSGEEIERVGYWLVDRELSPLDRAIAVARFRDNVERGAGPTVFVAVHEGHIVGTASLTSNDMPGMPRYSPWLTNVQVAEGYTGIGVCEALIRRVEQEALVLGFPWLYFKAWDNEEGFARLGWFCVDWSAEAEGRPALVLARDLRAAEQAA
ncbi:MAG TPA: GNAT family N-acetyltransferase [Gemmatimonadales bacterium]|nr:GNAT family N-acetyltransferase [Gemmatimonadales bacterium]